MRRGLLVLATLPLVLAHPAHAGGQPPSGTFTLSPGPYAAGQTVTITFSPLAHVPAGMEITLGVQCNGPNGLTLIPVQPEPGWYPANEPAYAQEAISFGGLPTKHFLLPDNGGAGGCTFNYVAVKHNKDGSIAQSWVLDNEGIAY